MRVSIRELMKGLPTGITIGVTASVILALSLPGPRPLAAELAATPPLGAVKECLDKPDGDACLDKLFREALQTQSPAQLLQLIQQYQNTDPGLRLSCHPVVHALGREIFRLKGNIHDSFAACDQTCHSGCYHGAVERFLRGDSEQAMNAGHVSREELARKAALACDPKTARRLYFQCLHGLGHALMYFSLYQLDTSLKACDTLPDDWSRKSCYGGVFMENVFSSVPGRRDISPTDYHYPCSRVDPRYRSECYLIQTWRMEEMGLTTERLFVECRNAGPHEIQCAQSVGRDLSNLVRAGQTRAAAAKCQLAQGESRQACIRGVVYALIDNTWDGRYALPFCAALREEDIAYCNEASNDYLRMFVGR
jgi:hypothetical protein